MQVGGVIWAPDPSVILAHARTPLLLGALRDDTGVNPVTSVLP